MWSYVRFSKKNYFWGQRQGCVYCRPFHLIYIMKPFSIIIISSSLFLIIIIILISCIGLHRTSRSRLVLGCFTDQQRCCILSNGCTSRFRINNFIFQTENVYSCSLMLALCILPANVRPSTALSSYISDDVIRNISFSVTLRIISSCTRVFKFIEFIFSNIPQSTVEDVSHRKQL